MSQVFKILAIDGGGIKGLFSAKILDSFEKQYNCFLADYFDMVCGTSTGSLIALSIALRKPMSEAINIYEKQGPVIFPSMSQIRGGYKQLLGYGKYSDKPLKKVLTGYFGNAKIQDSNTLLCIPSYNYTEGKPRVFKFDHPEGKLSRDNNLFMVDVALASSAAPTFLPLAEMEQGRQYIDGGVWANDPSLVGFLEAINFFVGQGKKYSSVEILSVPSINAVSGKSPGLKRQRSFRHWRGDLLEVFFSGQAYFTSHFMESMNRFNDIPVKYTRIKLPNISLDQHKIIGLDKTGPNSLLLLQTLGDSTGREWMKKEEVQSFFKTPKTYIPVKNGNA